MGPGLWNTPTWVLEHSNVGPGAFQSGSWVLEHSNLGPGTLLARRMLDYQFTLSLSQRTTVTAVKQCTCYSPSPTCCPVPRFVFFQHPSSEEALCSNFVVGFSAMEMFSFVTMYQQFIPCNARSQSTRHIIMCHLVFTRILF